MIDTKTRSKLNGLAQNIQPVFQIGKNGITDIVIKELNEVLDARELIKISILRNSELVAREVLDELCEKLSAEAVSCVGFKIALYRKSKRKDIKRIEL